MKHLSELFEELKIYINSPISVLDSVLRGIKLYINDGAGNDYIPIKYHGIAKYCISPYFNDHVFMFSIYNNYLIIDEANILIGTFYLDEQCQEIYCIPRNKMFIDVMKNKL